MTKMSAFRPQPQPYFPVSYPQTVVSLIIGIAFAPGLAITCLVLLHSRSRRRHREKTPRLARLAAAALGGEEDGSKVLICHGQYDNEIGHGGVVEYCSQSRIVFSYNGDSEEDEKAEEGTSEDNIAGW